VGYPYHPLYGKTAVILRKETNHGETHFRVIIEGREERLLPQWMFELHSFDPSPVEHPLISLASLLDLHRLVSSALSSRGIYLPEAAQEGSVDEPVTSVSIRRGKRKAAPRGDAKGAARARERLTGRSALGTRRGATATQGSAKR
jgi:hypothetical protein